MKVADKSIRTAKKSYYNLLMDFILIYNYIIFALMRKKKKFVYLFFITNSEKNGR